MCGAARGVREREEEEDAAEAAFWAASDEVGGWS